MICKCNINQILALIQGHNDEKCSKARFSYLFMQQFLKKVIIISQIILYTFSQLKIFF